MKTIIIVAVAADNAIGRNGDLAFHISADLRRFKALTTGHTVIMGRKTFESLPKGALPDRRNIVVSRNAGLAPALRDAGAEYAPSLEEALRMAREAGETEAFIIGGAQVYAASLPLADTLELTRIDATATGADAFFPEVDPAQWEVVEESDTAVDPRSGVPYSYVTLRRR